MSIQPRGEALRKAVKWISEMRADSDAALPKLIDDASLRFDLKPGDCEFLTRFFKENPDG